MNFHAMTIPLLAASMLIGGCVSNGPIRPSSDSPGAGSCQAVGEVPLPNGADFGRMNLLEEGVRWAVYVGVRPYDQVQGLWPKLPPQFAQALSPMQLDEMLVNAVKGSRRFEVFHAGHSLTNSYSNARVEMMLLPMEQQLRNTGSGYLKLHTKVLASVSVKDMGTGADLLGSDLQVMGQFGHRTDGGLVVRQPGELLLPENEPRRLHDLRQALADAMDQVRERLEAKLLPIARLEVARGCDLSLSGGTHHGFQPGDNLVVFRPITVDRTGTKRLVGATAVARAHCAGVNAEFSQCRITRLAPNQQPQAGDFAVLSPESKDLVRQR